MIRWIQRALDILLIMLFPFDVGLLILSEPSFASLIAFVVAGATVTRVFRTGRLYA